MLLTLMLMPLPDLVSWLPMVPTTVTSKPSRIQTVPRPKTTNQWNRDHGSRSRRAGMFVLIVPVCTPVLIQPFQLPGCRTMNRWQTV